MSNNTNWTDVIKKEARGLSDFDLGEVQEVSNGLILTQKGIVNKEIFSFPITVVESFDGNVLRLQVSEDDALNKFKKFIEKDSNIAETSNNIAANDFYSEPEGSKLDAVVDTSVDDSLKEALTTPTAEELGLEDKVEKELSALVDEPANSITDYSTNETRRTERKESEAGQDMLFKDEKSTKSNIEEKNPLKKEEAGIS
ncbi:MAG TPA: hypothetical protein VFT71_07475 [Candidatus Nitrosocosmicus sp.]|nr:hypothetical protein [Candidatus Nitrosocosmicus sp.]